MIARRSLLAAGALPLWGGRARAADQLPQPSLRNLFAEVLGKTEAELDQRIGAAYQHLFQGGPEQRIVFDVAPDMAYCADINNQDVRSEGMSYALMLAVQLNQQAVFNRLWRWATRFMRHAEGERRGYFAWSCALDGKHLDPGSASDGEAWIAMALLMAEARWGNSEGLLHYGDQAQALLAEMLHKPRTARVTPIYDPQEKQIVFAPTPDAAGFTDPSYHLPAFTEIWAQRAADAADRRTWREVTDTSRHFFKRAAHPRTGLMPEYAYFDGRPYTPTHHGPGKADFRYDAWRILANVAIDHQWWRRDAEWQMAQSQRVVGFLSANPKGSLFTLEGKALDEGRSLGLVAMLAVAGQGCPDARQAKTWLQRLWDAPMPVGRYRYYDGLLALLGLLQAGGRFRPWGATV